MVTTQLDFLHLRTTAGLARQVRRVARRMQFKGFEGHTVEWEEKLKKAIESGEIDTVVNDYKELLHLLMEKESYLYLIEKDELIMLNEEEKNVKKEFTLEQDLRPFLEQMKSSNPGLYAKFKEKFDVPLQKITYDIHKRTDEIRRILAFLKSDNIGGIARKDFINKMRSEKGLERSIARIARFEKKYVKDEQTKIEKMYDQFHQISAHVNKKEFKEAEKNLERIFTLEGDVFKQMEAEANYIYDIITKVTYIYVNLIDTLEHKIPETLKKLEELKFPNPKLEELKKEGKDAFDRIFDHLKDIYGLGRYQEIHAR
ncbi:MAG: hypothetical protein KKF46_03535 [Nanoarchaeota archaeon]|nr:hypothetical protein [Nanoarchaeota archaeon]MBU1321407.1 hypothetical protein [Nanoarchaeota archaeon]MBU1597886.1 hypothetical protein [Nanoarchaeota archaeon]MBU2442267.1 hypothetical protein [Nanoarchaeota archaeon]